VSITDSLRILINANGAQAEREFASVARSARTQLGQAETAAQRWGTTLTSAGVAMAAFGAVSLAGLGVAARAAQEEDLQIERLHNTIANSPALVGASTQAFLDQAAALQDTTRFADDATIGVQALLGQFGLTQDQIMELTPLVLDLASKMGISLQAAARAVGRATQGTAGGLSRMIGQFDVGSTSASAFAGTVQALRQQVGGFAAQEGQTFSGQLAILGNNLGDIAEGIGRGVVTALNSLLGPVEAVSDAFGRLTPGAQAAIGTLLTFGAIGLTAAGGLSFLVGQVLLMVERFPQMVSAIRSAAPELAAFAAATVLVVSAFEAWDRITGSGPDMFDIDVENLSDVTRILGMTADEMDRVGAALSALNADQLTDLFNQLITVGGEQGVTAVQRIRDAILEVDPSRFDALNEALLNTQSAAAATGALGDVRDEAQQAADSVQNLDDAWAGLNNTLTQFEAANNAAQAVQSLGDSFREAAEDGQITNSEMLGLNDSLVQVVRAFQDAADSATTNADGVHHAAAANRQLQAQLSSLAAFIPAQLRPQFNQLTRDILRVPNHHETRMTAPGATTVQQQLAVIRQRTDGVPRSIQMLIRMIGADGVIGDLQRIYAAAQQAAAAVGQTGGSLAGGGSYNAEGGTLAAWQMSVVGERGPELFIPTQSGRVVPTYQLRRALQGGGTETVVVNNYYFIRGDGQAREAMGRDAWDHGAAFLNGRG